MQFWFYIFVISCFLVFYNYAGYAIVTVVLGKIFGRPKPSPDPAAVTPTVSFIVAAFNEQYCIEEKVLNSLEQDYPEDKIEFIFITDGSTDATPDIIAKYPRIRLMHSPERRGKSVAVNRAVREAKNTVLIFSDANTILNKQATANIARHYQYANTGGVAGEKKVLPAPGDTPGDAGAGEGLYWKYESKLKQIDSDFYSVVGAAGELFSLRSDLYEELPHNVILDDFVLSLRVAEKGFRVIYEPDAYAMELPSFSLEDEQKRKIRIAAGGFQSMVMLKSLLLFWRHWRLSFLYVSHRALRWALSPPCLILALVSNLFLFIGAEAGDLFFAAALGAQIAFYGLAILSRIPPFSKNKIGKIGKVPYYFTFMNVSVILGFFRWLKGNQSAAWEKARRAQSVQV